MKGSVPHFEQSSLLRVTTHRGNPVYGAAWRDWPACADAFGIGPAARGIAEANAERIGKTCKVAAVHSQRVIWAGSRLAHAKKTSRAVGWGEHVHLVGQAIAGEIGDERPS